VPAGDHRACAPREREGAADGLGALVARQIGQVRRLDAAREHAGFRTQAQAPRAAPRQLPRLVHAALGQALSAQRQRQHGIGWWRSVVRSHRVGEHARERIGQVDRGVELERGDEPAPRERVVHRSHRVRERQRRGDARAAIGHAVCHAQPAAGAPAARRCVALQAGGAQPLPAPAAADGAGRGKIKHRLRL